MELLNTDDDPKGRLMLKSARHREQLEEEVKLISERTEKIITNALIIGGALAATYFLVSKFSGSKKKASKTRKVKLVSQAEEPEVVVESDEREGSGIISQIGSALASQATVLLLTFAKEKLGEFLQSHTPKKNENENP